MSNSLFDACIRWITVPCVHSCLIVNRPGIARKDLDQPSLDINVPLQSCVRIITKNDINIAADRWSDVVAVQIVPYRISDKPSANARILNVNRGYCP